MKTPNCTKAEDVLNKALGSADVWEQLKDAAKTGTLATKVQELGCSLPPNELARLQGVITGDRISLDGVMRHLHQAQPWNAAVLDEPPAS